MEIITKINDVHKIRSELRKNNKTIAFVPTMGYFHEGHLSLMRQAKELADVVFTSLYVNPAQFAPNEDFEKYPRDIDRDKALAEQNFTDYLFMPANNEMYPKGFLSCVHINGFTQKFEGVTRPHFFSGVATIVAKLFNIVKPHYAIFGQKDYQQSLLIKKLVDDLNFDIKIIIAATMREQDGLAMSSRNVYLTKELRQKAGIIFNSLENAIKVIEDGENRRKVINANLHNILRTVPEIRIDYAAAANADTLEETDLFLPGERIVLLIAAYLGTTRLIDNALVTIPADPKVKPYYFI